jgi:hypothetical protein
MSYQLYRVASPCADVSTGMLLGDYDTFDDALCARDDDTAQLFEGTTPGQVLLACHQILGPGALGPATSHPVTSEMPRAAAGHDDDITDAREWLRRIHTVT